MKKPEVIVLILILFCHSCRKEDDLISQDCDFDCSEIIGKIMTENGTVPVQNLELTVTWDNRAPIFGAGTVRTKAKTRTDSEGNFRLKFFIRDDEIGEGGFRMFYKEPDNSDFLDAGSNGISIFGIRRDTIFIRNHNIIKKARLNLRLLNLDQVQGNNRFSTNFSFIRPSGFSSQSIDGLFIPWSSEFDENQLIEVSGNQPMELKIQRTVNNVTTTEIDTLFLNAGTTNELIIDFIE